jgi:GT2 family glycosyltransferase
MKSNKKVSLIVLNYNGLQHLKECFDSIFEQTYLPNEIILFDNLSKDGSREFVRNNYPKVKIITEDSFNTGTAAGSNLAFKHAIGKYVIFQSNDIKLDKHCVEALVEVMEKDPTIGICTSVLINYYPDKKTGEHLIDNAGGITDIYGFCMQNRPTERLEDIPEQEEVFYSYGGSFIVRRELYEKVGGFDDRYFTLNDDIDLSWRIRLLGYKVVYNKKSFIYHKVSATLGSIYNRAQKRYWSERNSIRTFLKNASFKHMIKVLPMYCALLAGEMGYFLFRGRFDLFTADLKAIGWNLWLLPETLMLRHKFQSMRKDHHVENLLKKKSFKLMLFRDFSKSL